MGRQKGGKIMKIPAEFEDILRGVELTEREALFLSWITSWDDYTVQNMRTVVEKVRSALSTLQAENEKLRAELEQARESLDFARTKDAEIVRLGRKLEQVKRELQAYKDTGLEPEDFKRAFSEDTILKLAGQALGITPDRLRELAQADKEGISPCTFCRFNPPSSGDGKPCCMCPAEAALRREQDKKVGSSE